MQRPRMRSMLHKWEKEQQGQRGWRRKNKGGVECKYKGQRPLRNDLPLPTHNSQSLSPLSQKQAVLVSCLYLQEYFMQVCICIISASPC